MHVGKAPGSGPSAVRFSATDLAGHLACRHLTDLDFLAACGRLPRPRRHNDPLLEILQQRGLAHEQAFVDALMAEQQLSCVRIGMAGPARPGKGARGADGAEPAASVHDTGYGDAEAQTLAAMVAGTDIIVQAALASGRWMGRADILRKVALPPGAPPSRFGSWAYEVIDTKLARETAGGTILQLCLYAELVAEAQGLWPERVFVVSPATPPAAYRINDFAAYYRLVKKRLEAALPSSPGLETAQLASYPEPTSHCDICRWWKVCKERRQADDHLCLVAGIRASQRTELARWGVTTLTALGSLPLPISRKPSRGSSESYVRIREQARLQLAQRRTGAPQYELLEAPPGEGLGRLPAPSPGDLFIDFEGDPFISDGGLEFLFGYAEASAENSGTAVGHADYTGLWATTPFEERRAVERFLMMLSEKWQADPNLHIYHYAPYEPAALKRLVGRHNLSSDLLDRLLAAGVFIDLYAIVRQALRAGVEKYSIKHLEIFYGFERAVELRTASANLAQLVYALAGAGARSATASPGGAEPVDKAVAKTVEGYNRDDCLSALHLRNWLERLRAEAIAAGQPIERPKPSADTPSEEQTEKRKRARALGDRLTADLPRDADTGEPLLARATPEQLAKWLLANLLLWHDRENKVKWWEYYRLAELTSEELLGERAGVGGLTFVGAMGGTAKCPIHRYSFPAQELTLSVDDKLYAGLEGAGSVAAIDLGKRTLDIKKSQKAAGLHPEAVFVHQMFSTKEQEEALFRFGEAVASGGFSKPGSSDRFSASSELLLARPPIAGLAGRAPLVQPGESGLAAAERIALRLCQEGGVLPIQGPPGAGKTFTGSHVIAALVAAGKRVGVAGSSHKVIRHLLEKVVLAGRERGLDIRCAHKVSERASVANTGVGFGQGSAISDITGNAEVVEGIASGRYAVTGGTPFFWARDALAGKVDVLVIDEAGQLALASTLAMAQAGRSLILLGDPQQLEQPQQGTHPEGASASGLGHLLGHHLTVPEANGIFLAETHRLHPAICSFTSELFYESRLHPLPGLEQQRIASSTGHKLSGAGLFFVPVEHSGNQSSAPEEVEQVCAIWNQLMAEGTTWLSGKAEPCPLLPEHVRIVAPYNAQVSALLGRLPQAQVGTVDKFQGQEAPVVIISMTTSSADEAPRGMEFLYSLNRLNVATSRAKAMCILVASPRLFEPDCKTPAQMRLANAFCRYVEIATRIEC